MSILSVARDVCLVIGVDPPDTLMTNTEKEYLELARVARDAATMIAGDFDWQTLQVMNTYTGNGTDEAFVLPEDYDRMTALAQMWSSRWIWAFNHIANVDEWLEMLVVPYTFINGNWIIYGGQFRFLPVMQSTETIKFFYQSNLLAKDGSGTPKATFTADDDVFRLPEKLLEYAMIWKWKENKGLAYDEKKADYDHKFAELTGRDGGAKGIVRSVGRRYGRGVRLAFPQTVGQ